MTTAKRVYGIISGFNDLDEVSICYWQEDGAWWIYLPGVGAGIIPEHEIEEHEDGTISVTPSIRMAGRHGHLTRGEWSEC